MPNQPVLRETYLGNPADTTATAFWKVGGYHIPPGVQVVHERDWLGQHPHPEVCFKLVHWLDTCRYAPLPDAYTLRQPDPESDGSAISALVERCYPDIRLPEAQIKANANLPVFAPDLWPGVHCILTGQLIAAGLTDFDVTIGEASLEWLQVDAARRGHGIATFLIQERVRRVLDRASFMTVSGRTGSEQNLESLYRANGFVGNDRWYVWIEPIHA